MSQIRPLIAGNWKMNGQRASLHEIEALRKGVAEAGAALAVDIMVCPPATLIAAAAAAVEGSPILIGAQDCHAKASGAYTGDISAPMLADSGAKAVILGHSERRSLHGERDVDVRAKADAVLAAGLQAIICVGETAGEWRLGLTLDVVGRQLSGSLPQGATGANIVIAYEPIWAIGTGLTPTVADVSEVHRMIREKLGSILSPAIAEQIRILYGGSVKPDNTTELLTIPDVDGALVGGASLLARDFLAIISAQSSSAA